MQIDQHTHINTTLIHMEDTENHKVCWSFRG